MADFSLKTNFSVDGERYLLSTVKLHWCYERNMIYICQNCNEMLDTEYQEIAIWSYCPYCGQRLWRCKW